MKKATEYELTVSLEKGDRYFDRKYLLGSTNDAIRVMSFEVGAYDGEPVELVLGNIFQLLF